MPAPRHASCPRCAYDFTGERSRWTDRCPVHGRCAECGLDFWWGELFSLAAHPWLFEHHWRRGPIRRFVATIWHALRPNHFWRRVRLTDPIHLRPILTVLAGLFLAVCIAIFAAAATLNYQYATPSTGADLVDFLHDMVVLTGYAVRTMVFAPTLVVLMLPCTFILLPTTRRRARVRRAHLLRIATYGTLPLLLGGTIWILAFALLATTAPNLSYRIDPMWIGYQANRFLGIDIGDDAGGIVLAVLVAAWSTWWWRAAIRHYLRLPTPTLVAALLGLIALGIAVLPAML